MRSYGLLFGCAAKLKKLVYKHTRQESIRCQSTPASQDSYGRMTSPPPRLFPPLFSPHMSKGQFHASPTRRRECRRPHAGSGPPVSPPTPPRRPTRKEHTIPVLSRRPTSRPTRSRRARPRVFGPRTLAAVTAPAGASEQPEPLQVQQAASEARSLLF